MNFLRTHRFLTYDPRVPLEIWRSVMTLTYGVPYIPVLLLQYWRIEATHRDASLGSTLNESNANLLESLDDDYNVRFALATTTTTKQQHMIQVRADPIACLGGNGVGTCSYMNIFLA